MSNLPFFFVVGDLASGPTEPSLVSFDIFRVVDEPYITASSLDSFFLPDWNRVSVWFEDTVPSPWFRLFVTKTALAGGGQDKPISYSYHRPVDSFARGGRWSDIAPRGACCVFSKTPC